jgi:hypothetical protein
MSPGLLEKNGCGFVPEPYSLGLPARYRAEENTASHSEKTDDFSARPNSVINRVDKRHCHALTSSRNFQCSLATPETPASRRQHQLDQRCRFGDDSIRTGTTFGRSLNRLNERRKRWRFCHLRQCAASQRAEESTMEARACQQLAGYWEMRIQTR